jgi:TonB family protein
VILFILVDKKGKVAKAKVYQSSGSDLLDQSALDMIKSAEFEPGTTDREVDDFWLKLPVDFQLNAKELAARDIRLWKELSLAYLSEIYADSTALNLSALKKLFYQYQYMAHRIFEVRSTSANESVFMIVNNTIRAKWGDYKTDWPMGFLLFQDYIDRFPNSYYADKSMDELLNYLQQEIDLLQRKPSTESRLAKLLLLFSNYLKSIYNQNIKY